MNYFVCFVCKELNMAVVEITSRFVEEMEHSHNSLRYRLLRVRSMKEGKEYYAREKK